jgi:deoxyribodipyrimidine photolyase
MKVDLLGKNGSAPSFTPFKQHCYANLHVRKPDLFEDFYFETFKELSELDIHYDFEAQSSKLYEENKNIAVHGGRGEALKILNSLKNFDNYFEDRNFPALPATKFSAYLHFTNVSIREVYHKVA